MSTCKSFQWVVTAVGAVTLAACGGGGGGGGDNPPPPPATYTIGGTATGLSGSGLVLQLNGGGNLSVAANGAFTFGAALASGSAYAVTVLTQPSSPAQVCTVTNGSGTVASANVTNAAVSCVTTTYTIGGAVTGLAGSGLVLQLNGGNNLAINANGPFTFATSLATGAAYAVTVLTQPTNQPQNCTVTNGSGTVAAANITNASIACVPLVFTPSTGKLSTPRALHTATLLANGRILITGGIINSTLVATDSAELYDPVTNTSAPLGAAMTAVRNQHRATLLQNGMVLITGGSPDGDGDGTNTAELFNPATQTFTALSATMAWPRGAHSATLLQNGLVLIAGGFYDGPLVNSAELFNPATNTFTMLAATMTIDREAHGSSLLTNGQVLITGGQSGTAIVSSAELYNPITQAFLPLGAAMNSVRGLHSETVLPNGRVLLVGGIIDLNGPTNINVLNTAELYDVQTNSFLPLAATTTIPRGGHTATLLTNGNVILIGGVNGANSPPVVLDSVEVYGP